MIDTPPTKPRKRTRPLLKRTFTVQEILNIIAEKQLDKSYTHYNAALKDVYLEIQAQAHVRN